MFEYLRRSIAFVRAV